MLTKGKYYGLLILLLATGPYVFSQPSELRKREIIFEQLPEKLGVSLSSINCILQDKEGYLWIGTWSGLIRYDGYSTVVYHSDNAPDKIKSNKITAIYEDRNGFIWVGTHRGGLFRFDKNTDSFIHYGHDPAVKGSLSNDNVWSIREDKAGQLWVGTEHGLNVFNDKTKTFRVYYNIPGDNSSISKDFITQLFLSSSGDLWIGTQYGINKLIVTPKGDSVSYSFRNHVYIESGQDYALHHYIYQISETKQPGKDPVIWYTTNNGLHSVENGVIRNFTTEGKAPGYNFFRSLIAVNAPQPYLIAGSEMGLHFFDPGTNTFTRFLGNADKNLNLSHNTITALYMDRGGVFWVGTKKGLNKFDSYSKNFESYETESFDATGSIITGIRSAHTGGYWVSTIGGGLFRFNGKTFQRYTLSNQETNDFTNFIQTIYTDSKGDVWIGTAGAGIYRFNEKDIKGNTTLIRNFDHYTINSTPSLSDEYIMSLSEDDQGNMWVGTWSGGLNKITPEGKILQFDDPLLKQVPLVVMHADHSGVLWVGTRGNGLYRVKEKGDRMDIRHYSNTDDGATGLTNNFVNAIYEDHAGGLWIGTEGGLNALDRRTEKFTSHDVAQGPSNDVIVSILEDEGGKLWLAHWDGLTVIDPLNAQFVKNYDSHDRVKGGFFYNNVCFKDRNGNLLFGGAEGFTIIDPSTVVANPVSTKVAIKDFQVFNKPVTYSEEFDGRVILDKPLAEMEEIILHHSENSVSFEFTALDFAAPEKIRYAFMLEGFDEHWNYTSAVRRYANYTNLSSGDYTFKVKATNNDGVWNEQVSSVKLVIRPPWWKTIWAGVGYVIASILILRLFRMFILMRANLMHDIKLERVQRENLEKLNHAKLQFFTNVSHEFRTPLTLILGPVQQLLDSGEGGKFVREQILRVNKNAQRLLRLVNQLLDFRKVESGNLKLEAAEGNIVKFIKEIKLSFDPLAEQLNITLALHTSSNVIHVWFDRDQFEKVLYNLLSNAFKHTSEGGTIVIQVKEEKEHVVIEIEDNGRGIKAEHFEHIFQTFFSYDEDKHHTGTGIGLALTRSLVEMHHGDINVVSEENKFTRFTLRLPLGNAHLDISERQQDFKDSEDIEKYPSLTTGDLAVMTGVEQEANGMSNVRDLSKILIVEDNAEVRAYIHSVFTGHYIILEAEEGKEALDIALEETPDLVISDVMMPVMDGITLCKHLKSNIKTSHIPVILLTARTSLIFKVEGLETGADDYVSKPFNSTLLKLKVRNLIRSRDALQKMFRDNEVLTIEPKRVTLNSQDEAFVAKSLESIETNMANPEYAVEDLGRDVGMSRMQLYRKLKALTGQSANEFIRTIRLKRAAQLLEQHQLTIAEVTYEVGFSDLQYFRECFKKQFGLTPSEYVQRKAGNTVPDES